MYVYQFQNAFLRCPTPRLQFFLSSHWPSFRFLSFMAFLIPSIQFFFGLPRALFCFGIHFNAILGNRPSAILWTWSYHVSWFVTAFQMLQFFCFITVATSLSHFISRLALIFLPSATRSVQHSPTPTAVHIRATWTRYSPFFPELLAPLTRLLWLLLLLWMHFQLLQNPFLYLNSFLPNLQATVQISQPYIKIPSTTLHNILLCMFHEIRLLPSILLNVLPAFGFARFGFTPLLYCSPGLLQWILRT